MPTDNEAIIEILDETQRFLRSKVVALIDANPSSWVLNRYLECLSNMGGIVNELGSERLQCHPTPLGREREQGLEGVLEKLGIALERMNERLAALENKNEASPSE